MQQVKSVTDYSVCLSVVPICVRPLCATGVVLLVIVFGFLILAPKEIATDSNLEPVSAIELVWPRCATLIRAPNVSVKPHAGVQ